MCAFVGPDSVFVFISFELMICPSRSLQRDAGVSVVITDSRWLLVFLFPQVLIQRPPLQDASTPCAGYIATLFWAEWRRLEGTRLETAACG